ncbi:SAV_915 family protein [Kitasatospora sp. NPDC092039]|uniref:SAV_915 family protein n=1 Tax=Kitasatospora sp. NPDC092039 TaxID=3364086 RepID=UPI0037F4FA3C
MARLVWHVPVTASGTGSTTALRLFRLRDGRRCAVGFSSLEALTALLGPDQAHTELGEPALRGLLAPLGIDALVVDPRLVAPSVTAAPTTAPPATAPSVTAPSVTTPSVATPSPAAPPGAAPATPAAPPGAPSPSPTPTATPTVQFQHR